MGYGKDAHQVGYNVSETARLLGRSRKWTHDQIKAGNIPCVRISDRVFVVPRAWFESLAGKEVA